MRGLALRLLLILCVLASTAQGFVAQTHVHAGATLAPVTAGGPTVVDVPPGEEPKCVLCDVAGHSPAAAPPADSSFVAVADPSRLLQPAARRAVLAAAPSHHWSGRGPPLRLSVAV
jgi:hypothetical protein